MEKHKPTNSPLQYCAYRAYNRKLKPVCVCAIERVHSYLDSSFGSGHTVTTPKA